MKKILFLTNGHGEDKVAFEIIKKISGKAESLALPIVGEGKDFKDFSNAELLGPRKSFPSGGFSLRNLKFLLTDLARGLFVNFIGQVITLFSLRKKVSLVVAIGDIVPFLYGLIIRAPIIYVGVNKSYYYKTSGFSYTSFEIKLLKKFAKKIFVRDEITRGVLMSKGITAEFAGNPLMDCSDIPSNPVRDKFVIGFLPGTRERDVKLNVEDFHKLVFELERESKKFKFLIATKENVPEPFIRVSFTELLEKSGIVIGLSGTGNEQAAGLGIPVISFPGRGSQYNKRFASVQKQLLGAALEYVPNLSLQDISDKVVEILNDHEKYLEMSQVGQRRMEKRDAVSAIAKEVLDSLHP